MAYVEKKNFIEELFEPFQRFLRIQSSGGIVLMGATLIALIWANSPFGHLYKELWETHISIKIGSFELEHSILHWINDGLMAIFFFVVGLEIKREILVGELSTFKKASLPIAAAIGGMIFPAVIYTLLNVSEEAKAGWGIPMATDIAFSLGVLSLLGNRVPLSLKIFLVAFAIADDLGAVTIIALFYSHDIHINYLLIGLGLLLMLFVFNRIPIRSYHPYMLVGWIIWYMFLEAGVHPTIAGVLIAFSIPANRKIKLSVFRNRIEHNLVQFCDDRSHDPVTLTHKQLAAIDNIEVEIKKVQSPLQELEHNLNGFVTFIVMPIFALTNAGVTFKGGDVGFINPLSMDIELSLILGKVSGIFLFTWLSVKTGIAELPANVKWVHILGLGFLGGMGFTMSLFISNLAFGAEALLNPAKIGILVGSFIAGVTGYIVLRSSLKISKEEG